ncbi:histone-like nucleoid-structuring protein Lsr2 [Streptomyces anulatus]|uniref:histone-like nucleoid-structuring protein Lsr2 n=1 Tax=Streptomyces anulatus TaxID=1892 RepID=UPI00342869B0
MRRRIITLVDDLDNTTLADETVLFALDGTQYEIDLTTANANTLRNALAPFTKAARPATRKSRSTKPSTAPMTTPAGGGATLSRHQSGIDPAKARSWARRHGLHVPERGRLPAEIRDAYSVHDKFGDRTRLDALLQKQRDDHAPAPQPAAPDAAAPEDTAGMLLAVAALTPASPESPTVDAAPDGQSPTAEAAPEGADDDEATARKHYLDLKKAGRLSSRASAPGYWERRTAGGLEHTDKVEKMTLTERISILSPRNLDLLGKLAGILNLDKGGKVSYLAGSVQRLENLEVIVEDSASPHGWSITDFGRYAHKVHSMGE